MTRRASKWVDLGPGWLFDNIRDAVIVADADTAQVALWNPAATDLFGFSTEAALQLTLRDLIDDVEASPQWAAACSGSPERQTIEVFARCKAGPEVCVE